MEVAASPDVQVGISDLPVSIPRPRSEADFNVVSIRTEVSSQIIARDDLACVHVAPCVSPGLLHQLSSALAKAVHIRRRSCEAAKVLAEQAVVFVLS